MIDPKVEKAIYGIYALAWMGIFLWYATTL